MNHETSTEMLALHALSALVGPDQVEVQQHIQTCSACRLELTKWDATAAALAYATVPVEPSAQLRNRILERIRSEDGGSASSAQSSVLTFSRPRAKSKTWLLAGAAIAASLVFIALSAALIVVWRQNSHARSELARLSNQLHVEEQKMARENQIVQILTTPGSQASELAGTKDAPNAHAVLAVDRQSGRAVLAARGLPIAPSGKAYQLWFISSGRPPAPGRVFTTDASGNALLADQLPASASDASVFAVTLEPQAGVAAPTGSMYLLSPANSRL